MTLQKRVYNSSKYDDRISIMLMMMLHVSDFNILKFLFILLATFLHFEYTSKGFTCEMYMSWVINSPYFLIKFTRWRRALKASHKGNWVKHFKWIQEQLHSIFLPCGFNYQPHNPLNKMYIFRAGVIFQFEYFITTPYTHLRAWDMLGSKFTMKLNLVWKLKIVKLLTKFNFHLKIPNDLYEFSSQNRWGMWKCLDLFHCKLWTLTCGFHLDRKLNFLHLHFQSLHRKTRLHCLWRISKWKRNQVWLNLSKTWH